MKNLILFIATCVVSMSAWIVQAQKVIPYLPVKADFAGMSVDIAGFRPPVADYTLEVEGTAGQEISVAEGVYTYTPESTGKVRFSQKNGKVYVYEGNTYKATLTPGSPVVFPDLLAEKDDASSPGTGIYDVSNLIENPGFETNVAGKNNYEDHTYWSLYNSSKVLDWNGGSGNSIRKGSFTEGSYYMLLHKTAAYFTQTLAAGKIKPNTFYKIKYNYRTNASDQNNATYRVELGSAEFDTDLYTSNTYTTQANTNTMTFEASFQTDDRVSVENPTYFSIHRTVAGSNSNKQCLDWLDRITLVEGRALSGITGAANAVYLVGSAYSPEVTVDFTNGEYYDVTHYMDNPSFETGTLGTKWITTGTGDTGVKLNSNKTYTTIGVDGSYLFNTWNSGNGGALEQTITGLPNGLYTMVALIASDAGLAFTGFLNDAQSDVVTIAGDKTAFQEFKIERVNVTDHTVRLGINAGKWYKADHFRLYYYGYDSAAAIADLREELQIAEGLKSSKMYVGILNELADASTSAEAAILLATEEALADASANLLTAVANARASIARYDSLQVAITDATAYKAAITTPDSEAQNAFQKVLDEATDVYTNGSMAETVGVIASLQVARIAYMYAQPAPADYTALLTNPGFENGLTDWEKTQNSTNGYGEGVNADEATEGANSYFYRINGYMRHATIYRTLKGLKPGVYTIAADVSGNPLSLSELEGTFVYATTGAVDHWAGSKAGCFRGYVKAKGLTKVNEWETLSATFTLSAESDVRIGVLSWGTNKSDAEKHGAFRADHFTLTYLGEGRIETVENTVTAHGNVNLAELNNALTETITSLDATEVVSAGEITPANPNTIVYGLPAHITLTQGIPEGGAQPVAIYDTYSFHAPKALTATVSYIRAFNRNGTSCNEKNGNWQTICLPFDVASVYAMQNGNTISLTPISNFGNDDTDESAARPFWLYEITAGNLVPAGEMKANVPYLIAVPNDPAVYKDFYNVSGEVTFSGNIIEGTDPQSGATETYRMTANFTPIAGNADDYGINSAGTYFVPGVDIRSFSAKVAPIGTARPAQLLIFEGDADVTGLPCIPVAPRQKDVEVFNTENGVLIQSKGDAQVPVYTASGKLLSVIAVSEGMNDITLVAGEYVINGGVVIVK